MAYTRVWDNTFPPDTQAANLLGQDIRNTKVDIQERLAGFLSNTFANRPTPEASWVGLVFFATDTGAVYRWNGASWDPMVTNKAYYSGSAVVNPTVTIPANTLVNGNQVLFSFAGGNGVAFSFSIGGTVVASTPGSGTLYSFGLCVVVGGSLIGPIGLWEVSGSAPTMVFSGSVGALINAPIVIGSAGGTIGSTSAIIL